MEAQRPRPVPNADTRPYWDAAKSGVLSLPRCADCGRVICPPKPACPTCRSIALDWVTLSGRARLKGWSRIHIAAIPGRDGPITVVEATLAEDERAVLIALDETGAAQTLAPDAPLLIGFQDDPNGFAYPVVTPAGEVG